MAKLNINALLSNYIKSSGGTIRGTLNLIGAIDCQGWITMRGYPTPYRRSILWTDVEGSKTIEVLSVHGEGETMHKMVLGKLVDGTSEGDISYYPEGGKVNFGSGYRKCDVTVRGNLSCEDSINGLTQEDFKAIKQLIANTSESQSVDSISGGGKSLVFKLLQSNLERRVAA